ncbi:toxin co-regulated pilus biosynthesis Q family protein [Alteromonas sp. ASW11-130]|uniref:toxin co-regulated pilus biosynthesis Q family protein n=1 Tax=Alteromonas sp. ASW11-130 TaxID=3015775 RepID=UPI0022428088|nr:toxin co-regulated pilus biosynthesis Q family protein [Alteromonas sp. ASW11-130]MCW8091254.1 toxin co-regulated pilus biosynthesis Q family protein [Alteromonas sp. ASW11-130]
MAQTGFSSSLFWVKHIVLALVLIIVAGVLIHMQSENETAPLAEGETKQKSVSKGLSDFYREFRMSSDERIKENKGDFVIEISNGDQTLDSQLQGMSSDIKPVNKRWVGEHKQRSFKAGGTLRETISTYAELEGMQVIWDLDQDFVIKHHFQVNGTIVKALSDIATAIDSNFAGEVKTYICPKQRSLVVTQNKTKYLKTSCSEVKRS